MDNNIIDLTEYIDNNWKNHIDNVNSQIYSMWNYLLYNQFCDKQVLLLNEVLLVSF